LPDTLVCKSEAQPEIRIAKRNIPKGRHHLGPEIFLAIVNEVIVSW